MKIFHPLRDIEHPEGGWISQIRKALNMSLRQLGERLSLTPQGVKRIENAEADGSLTINSLREAGDALGLKLVYGFVPHDGSLEKMIERQAAAMAYKIVMRTSTTMTLEDQQNSDQRIKDAIAEMTEELKREMSKSLWD